MEPGDCSPGGRSRCLDSVDLQGICFNLEYKKNCLKLHLPVDLVAVFPSSRLGFYPLCCLSPSSSRLQVPQEDSLVSPTTAADEPLLLPLTCPLPAITLLHQSSEPGPLRALPTKCFDEPSPPASGQETHLFRLSSVQSKLIFSPSPQSPECVLYVNHTLGSQHDKTVAYNQQHQNVIL